MVYKYTFYSFFLLILGMSVQAQKKAGKTSFEEVSKYLHEGGNYYLYVDSTQTLTEINSLLDTFKGVFNERGIDGEENKEVDAFFNMLTDGMKTSGLNEISGVGFSSIARSKGFYHNRMFIHHWPDQKGKIWQIAGRENQDLSKLKFPANAVIAYYGDIDMKMAWSWMNDLFKKHAVGEMKASYEKMMNNADYTNFNFDEMMKHVDGDVFVSIAMDDKKMVDVKVERNFIKVPEVSLVMGLKMRTNYLKDTIEKDLIPSGKLVKVQSQGMTIYQAKESLMKPLDGKFTMAYKNNMMYISSSETALFDMLKVQAGKAPNLLDTAEFKGLSKGLKMEGNQFSYLSPRLVTNLVKMSDSIPPEHKEMVKFAIKELIPESNFIVSVTSRTKDGILVSTNSSLDGATSTISQIGVAPLAIVAGMTLPALSKAREKARRANCASNMKQLGLALLMHAAENDGRFPDSLDKLAEQNLLNASKVYRCPSSLNADDAPADANDIRQGKTDYVYCGQGVKDDDDDATNVIILYEKDDNHPGGQWMNFLFVDGHVEGFAVNGGGIQEALKQNPKWKLGRPAKKNQ